MKYYVVLIVTFIDGSNDKVAIYNYATDNQALSNFYKLMGQYVNADNVKTVSVEVKSNLSSIHEESWSAPIQEIE